MKKIDGFTNLYPVTKTLRFGLIPVGKTQDNFEKNQVLLQDKKKAEAYERVKKYIDRCHKYYIDEILSKVMLEKVQDYAALYYKQTKTDSDKKVFKSVAEQIRKQIATALTKNPSYADLWGKKIIETTLPNFLTDEFEQNDVIENFSGFSTYFTGFNKNRENMYSAEEKSTAIAYRCVNENLPKFLDNVKTFEKHRDLFKEVWFDETDEAFEFINGTKSRDIFSIDYFSFVLSQKGIDKYNGIIGGYTLKDGTKIQGLNEKINLYNQTVSKEYKIPKFKMLFKQILSDKESVSYIPEKFKTDDEVLQAIDVYFSEKLDLKRIAGIFEKFDTYDENGIYISAGLPVTAISKKLFGNWSSIDDVWNTEYDSVNMKKQPKDYEKYSENRKKAYKANKSFSVFKLQSLCDKVVSDEICCNGSIKKYYSTEVLNLINEIIRFRSEANDLLTTPYTCKKRLSANEDAVSKIKNLLDSVKELERLLKSLLGTGEEPDKNELFYGEFLEAYSPLRDMDKLYDKARNYITQKPYSNDKIKLNFGNPQFLEGWATNLELQRSAQLFKLSDNEYYLGVIDKNCKSNIPTEYNSPENKEDTILKICYEQMSSPSKDIPNLMFISGQVKKVNGRKDPDGINRKLEETKNNNLPKDINNIRLRCGYSVSPKNATKSEITKFIDYYKAAVIAYYSNFNFILKNADEYESYSEFVSDVDRQAYQINYIPISKKQIYDFADNGYIYLFKIYNKDFSKNKKAVGTDNLHTMYFKILFNEENLKNVVYKLNGKAEMFYRKPSINDDEKIVHPANQPIDNKNPLNKNKTSTFSYDIVKDKRYTEPKFMLHIPITMNFQAAGMTNINEKVRECLVDDKENYVIGIDRGERNLIYVCVINSHGDIVEQFSLNEIVNEYKGQQYKTDYNSALGRKSADMLNARKNWTQIENIKELKEGYISQVVRKICDLTKKYDAVIAMENLNSGFKNSRKKVEKQVYQKFEKMLIDKLNYMVDKKADINAQGGLLNAYQLTNKFESFEKMGVQNGFIFYIPAWLTSKIDPTTGFVNLLDTRYHSVEASKKFIEAFDDIRYNDKNGYFEFDMDYFNFPQGTTSYKKKWTLCTYSTRIKTYRSPENNNQFVNEEIVLTNAFIELFDRYGVDYKAKSLKENILALNNKDFFATFMKHIGLLLQMRNSITNDAEVDYLISPVKNSDGYFYDSRVAADNLPKDADANGAYNIARKALWAIEQFKSTNPEELSKVKISIKNSEWLEYTQK